MGSPGWTRTFGALRERLAEISDLARAGGVLAWDQRVTMPPRRPSELGPRRSPRSRRVSHEKFIDAETGRLLERLRPLEESLSYDSDDASLIRVTRRDWEKQRRVPTEPRGEMTRAAARGNPVWVEARGTNDFAHSFPRSARTLS